MNISANFSVVNLEGSMGVSQLGDGLSAATVHRVYCLDAGSIEIEAMGGGTFEFNATTNEYIDVVVRSVTVNSGTFIGFKSKDNYRFNTEIKF